MEDEIIAGESSRVDDASIEALLIKVTDAPPPGARRARLTVDGARRPLNRQVLSLYVEPMEWARPTENESDPDQEIVQALILEALRPEGPFPRAHVRSLPSQLPKTDAGSWEGILHLLPRQPG